MERWRAGVVILVIGCFMVGFFVGWAVAAYA
jgi:hypothetical protein